MAIDIRWSSSHNQWIADVPTREGKRKREYFGKDKNLAKAQLFQLLSDYYAGKSGCSQKLSRQDGTNLIVFIRQFLDWNMANRSKGTWKTYRDGLQHLIKRYPDKFVQEITPQDIEVVKTDMVRQGYSARSVNKLVQSVIRLYNWGVSQNIIQHNPLSGVERVSQHVNAPRNAEKKHIPLQKVKNCIILCQNSPPLHHICEFILLTGMRIGEVIRITWPDINFEQKFLTLDLHKTSGRSARPRTIPLCGRAAEILKCQKNQTDVESRDGLTVFRGHKGQPFTVYSLHCRLRRLRKRYPELTGFSFHRLRHTCATYLARQQVPERVAQAILGHGSTLMTRHYTATDSSEMIEAAEKLSEATGNNSKT